MAPSGVILLLLLLPVAAALGTPGQPQGISDTPASLPGAPSGPIGPRCSPEGLEPSQPPSCPGPHPPGSCSGCGPVSLSVLAGLMAADAVASLFIIAVVFVCACPHHRPSLEDDKVYINMPVRG